MTATSLKIHRSMLAYKVNNNNIFYPLALSTVLLLAKVTHAFGNITYEYVRESIFHGERDIVLQKEKLAKPPKERYQDKIIINLL